MGAGRRTLAYHPERLRLSTDAGAFEVDLPPLHPGTRSVAAELLHPVGGGELVLRSAWRFYALDVSTPVGASRRGLRDLELGVRWRVTAF